MSLMTLEQSRTQTTYACSRLREIQAWPHWQEVLEGAKKEYALSEQEVNRVFPEYQRFLCLLAIGHHHLSMSSITVDHLWHAHILYTPLYAQFCQEHIGHFIHHVPVLGRNRYCTTSEDICGDKCDTGPDTDPIPVPPKDSIEAKFPAYTRFRTAYLQAFGEVPGAIWNLPPEKVDGNAMVEA